MLGGRQALLGREGGRAGGCEGGREGGREGAAAPAPIGSLHKGVLVLFHLDPKSVQSPCGLIGAWHLTQRRRRSIELVCS